MITFNQIKQLMKNKTQDNYCIEILFSVRESSKFDCCWMGKIHDNKLLHDIYWFGLTPDGKNAYEYKTFDEMVSAKVFDGSSFSDIWDNIEISEIDGCDPSERLMIGLQTKNKE